MLRLILGGTRSGKSDWALDVLLSDPAPRHFLATGQAGDPSFRRQINDHRVERGPGLPVRETGVFLAEALEDIARECDGHGSVLVDSLDFWLFAAQTADNGAARVFLRRLDALRERYPALRLNFVSSEIGLGPIPASAEVRAFARSLGTLHRELACRSNEAVLVVAGLPVHLKSTPGQ